jgi:ABC-type molybdate transport system substrate-binding protein
MTRQMVLGLALLVAAAALLLPGTAAAATVSVELPGTLVYAAAAGETNALNIHMDGALVVFHDSGATITLGDFTQSCNQSDQNTVACEGGSSRDPCELSWVTATTTERSTCR